MWIYLIKLFLMRYSAIIRFALDDGCLSNLLIESGILLHIFLLNIEDVCIKFILLEINLSFNISEYSMKLPHESPLDLLKSSSKT